MSIFSVVQGNDASNRPVIYRSVAPCKKEEIHVAQCLPSPKATTSFRKVTFKIHVRLYPSSPHCVTLKIGVNEACSKLLLNYCLFTNFNLFGPTEMICCMKTIYQLYMYSIFRVPSWFIYSLNYWTTKTSRSRIFSFPFCLSDLRSIMKASQFASYCLTFETSHGQQISNCQKWGVFLNVKHKYDGKNACVSSLIFKRRLCRKPLEWCEKYTDRYIIFVTYLSFIHHMHMHISNTFILHSHVLCLDVDSRLMKRYDM